MNQKNTPITFEKYSKAAYEAHINDKDTNSIKWEALPKTSQLHWRKIAVAVISEFIKGDSKKKVP